MQTSRKCFPEHPVPTSLAKLCESNGEKVKIGIVEAVRVHLIGILERNAAYNPEFSTMDYVLTDEEKKHRFLVVQQLTSEKLVEDSEDTAGKYVEVFGKVRTFDDGKKYVTAHQLRFVSKAQYDCFQTILEMSNKFYEKNTPVLPPGTETKVPEKYGLKKKLGNLDRFPITMIEESADNITNGGVWPKEMLEELSLANQGNNEEKDSDVSDEDSDVSDEDSDESDESQHNMDVVQNKGLEDEEYDDEQIEDEEDDDYQAGREEEMVEYEYSSSGDEDEYDDEEEEEPMEQQANVEQGDSK